MLEMPVLESARLRVRPLTVEDVADCHNLYLEVGWTDGGVGEAANLELRRSWVEWSVRNYVQLARLNQPPYGDRAIVRKDGDEFVGLVGLVPSLGPFSQLPSLGGMADSPFTPEIGLFWAVRPKYQRQGFATEAAMAVISYAQKVLRPRRVVATTEHDNLASMAVMRKLGMRIERNPFPTPPWFQTVGILEYQ